MAESCHEISTIQRTLLPRNPSSTLFNFSDHVPFPLGAVTCGECPDPHQKFALSFVALLVIGLTGHPLIRQCGIEQMQAELRNLWRHAASPVSIITTSLNKRLAGMTISSLTSVSMGPPHLLVSFNCQTPSRTADILRARNKLVLNLLAADPSNVLLAKAFAGRVPEGHDTNPFNRYPHLFETLSESEGIPTIKNASRILCEVMNVVSAQDHEIVIAKVDRVWINETCQLIYRNHKFWSLGKEVEAC